MYFTLYNDNVTNIYKIYMRKYIKLETDNNNQVNKTEVNKDNEIENKKKKEKNNNENTLKIKEEIQKKDEE